MIEKQIKAGPFTFSPTGLDGSFVVEPGLFSDNRGWFFRSYSDEAFAEMGLNTTWPQANHSFTQQKGSIRGMHFQYPPFGEIKLVRCVSGAVLDIIVDIRKDSPTYLQHFSIELNPTNKRMLYIPQGFAHGFQTLKDDCELLYMHSATYQPGSEGGLRFNDAQLNLTWPLPLTIISERDSNHPMITNDFKGI